MIARTLLQSDLDAAPWQPFYHQRTAIFGWQVPAAMFFPTGDDGPNIYLAKGEWLCWRPVLEDEDDIGVQLRAALEAGVRFWKLTVAEMKDLYEPAT